MKWYCFSMEIYTVLDVLDYYPSSCFYLKQRFGDWTLPPSSGKETYSLGPNWVPEPVKVRLYK
jgi:hypothetical protein